MIIFDIAIFIVIKVAMLAAVAFTFLFPGVFLLGAFGLFTNCFHPDKERVLNPQPIRFWVIMITFTILYLAYVGVIIKSGFTDWYIIKKLAEGLQ